MSVETNQQDNLTVRQITADDWQAYKDYYKGLAYPHHYDGFLKGKDLDSRETYQNLLESDADSWVMFGLWRGDKMIGQTAIWFTSEKNEKIAHLAGSEIADEYRGQRLVNHLYKARMDYLAQIGFQGPIEVSIKPDNINSQKAAKRNGFVNTGRVNKEHGTLIFALAHQGVAKPALPTPEKSLRNSCNTAAMGIHPSDTPASSLSKALPADEPRPDSMS